MPRAIEKFPGRRKTGAVKDVVDAASLSSRDKRR